MSAGWPWAGSPDNRPESTFNRITRKARDPNNLPGSRAFLSPDQPQPELEKLNNAMAETENEIVEFLDDLDYQL